MSKRKDKEADRAYEREYYHRTKNTPRGKAKRERIKEYRKTYYPDYYEKNREKVIEDVRKRRLNEYGGTCKICGKRTMGQSKKNPGPSFCIDHRKEQWVEKKQTEEKRRAWREAKRRQREKDRAGIITVEDLASTNPKKQRATKMTQKKMSQPSSGAKFSRLKRDEQSPREWGSQ